MYEVNCLNGKTFYIDAKVCKGKILMPNENYFPFSRKNVSNRWERYCLPLD